MLNTLDGLFVVRPVGPKHCAKGRTREGHPPTAKGQSVTENEKRDDVVNEPHSASHEENEDQEPKSPSDSTKPVGRTSRWCTDVTEQELESGDKLYGGIKDLDPDQLQPDCEPRNGE